MATEYSAPHDWQSWCTKRREKLKLIEYVLANLELVKEKQTSTEFITLFAHYTSHSVSVMKRVQTFSQCKQMYQNLTNLAREMVYPTSSTLQQIDVHYTKWKDYYIDKVNKWIEYLQNRIEETNDMSLINYTTNSLPEAQNDNSIMNEFLNELQNENI